MFFVCLAASLGVAFCKLATAQLEAFRQFVAALSPECADSGGANCVEDNCQPAHADKLDYTCTPGSTTSLLSIVVKGGTWMGTLNGTALNGLSALTSLQIENAKKIGGTFPALNLPLLRSIDLNDMNLSPQLPTDWSRLPQLRVLKFEGMRGAPSFTGTLQLPTTLTVLSLKESAYSALPSNLCNLSELETFEMYDIPTLSGRLPSCLKQLSRLTKIDVSNCALSGSVPSLPQQLTDCILVKASEANCFDDCPLQCCSDMSKQCAVKPTPLVTPKPGPSPLSMPQPEPTATSRLTPSPTLRSASSSASRLTPSPTTPRTAPLPSPKLSITPSTRQSALIVTTTPTVAVAESSLDITSLETTTASNGEPTTNLKQDSGSEATWSANAYIAIGVVFGLLLLLVLALLTYVVARRRRLQSDGSEDSHNQRVETPLPEASDRSQISKKQQQQQQQQQYQRMDMAGAYADEANYDEFGAASTATYSVVKTDFTTASKCAQYDAISSTLYQ